MFGRKLYKLLTETKTKFRMSTSEGITANEKKLEHYKNLNALEDTDTKPNGWNEAKPFDNLPGPKPLPIIGNMWRFVIPKIGDFYRMDFVDVQRRFCKQYGDIVIFKGLLGNSLVMLFNPKDFETLVRNDGVWPIRKMFPSLEYYYQSKKDILLNLGLSANHGEKWFKIRSAVNPILLKPRNIVQYTDEMNLVDDELVDNMKYLAQQNAKGEMPSDFQNELYKWALESVAIVTLDTQLGCLKRNLEPDSEPQKLIDCVIQWNDLMFKLDILPSVWKYVSTPDWKQYVKALDFMMGTNIKHIDSALNKLAAEEIDTENKTKSVLQQLLKKDRNIAVAVAMDMMSAGIDTTGRILGAGLYYLARNPEKQEQLRTEAKALLKNKDTPITNEALSKAHYLKAVVKEVTRLAPVGISNMRTTGKDLVLAGYQIPKGTTVLTSNLILCLMDEYFPRAAEFLPERWLSKASDNLSHKTANPFIFAPFGYGPRSCVGKRLANLELEIAFLKIIRNFQIFWPHEDMTFTTSTFYGMAKPLKIQIRTLDQ